MGILLVNIFIHLLQLLFTVWLVAIVDGYGFLSPPVMTPSQYFDTQNYRGHQSGYQGNSGLYSPRPQTTPSVPNPSKSTIIRQQQQINKPIVPNVSPSVNLSPVPMKPENKQSPNGCDFYKQAIEHTTAKTNPEPTSSWMSNGDQMFTEPKPLKMISQPGKIQSLNMNGFQPSEQQTGAETSTKSKDQIDNHSEVKSHHETDDEHEYAMSPGVPETKEESRAINKTPVNQHPYPSIFSGIKPRPGDSSNGYLIPKRSNETESEEKSNHNPTTETPSQSDPIVSIIPPTVCDCRQYFEQEIAMQEKYQSLIATTSLLTNQSAMEVPSSEKVSSVQLYQQTPVGAKLPLQLSENLVMQTNSTGTTPILATYQEQNGYTRDSGNSTESLAYLPLKDTNHVNISTETTGILEDSKAESDKKPLTSKPEYITNLYKNQDFEVAPEYLSASSNQSPIDVKDVLKNEEYLYQTEPPLRVNGTQTNQEASTRPTNYGLSTETIAPMQTSRPMSLFEIVNYTKIKNEPSISTDANSKANSSISMGKLPIGLISSTNILHQNGSFYNQ